MDLYTWQNMGQGSHSISEDPLLILSAGGSYQLQSGSQGINAGANDILPWLRYDFDRNLRLIDEIDLGPFEYIQVSQEAITIGQKATTTGCLGK